MRLNPEQHRIAILMHQGLTSGKGKTGHSVLRYSEIPVVAVIDQEHPGGSVPELTGINADVPIVDSVKEAMAHNPNVLLIGIAPSGGALPDEWFAEVQQAVELGLSIVNGLHTPMAKHPDLAPLVKDNWIWDVRKEPGGLRVGSGMASKLPCSRVLTVGTDMSIGKMSTGIELHRAAVQRGISSYMIATGQTGLMLGYDGIPLDSIRVDFAAGAVEQLMMRYGYDYEILFVEGQGSFMNPASTATLPLMRGSQPTHLILVHKAGQRHIENFPEFAIPPLKKAIEVYETVATAGGTFRAPEVEAIALNTYHLSERDAIAAIQQVQIETGLPCTDVIRFGPEPILDAILRD